MKRLEPWSFFLLSVALQIVFEIFSAILRFSFRTLSLHSGSRVKCISVVEINKLQLIAGYSGSWKCSNTCRNLVRICCVRYTKYFVYFISLSVTFLVKFETDLKIRKRIARYLVEAYILQKSRDLKGIDKFRYSVDIYRVSCNRSQSSIP